MCVCVCVSEYVCVCVCVNAMNAFQQSAQNMHKIYTSMRVQYMGPTQMRDALAHSKTRNHP